MSVFRISLCCVCLKGSYNAGFFTFSLVCYVAVCACVRSAELQSSKSPTKLVSSDFAMTIWRF